VEETCQGRHERVEIDSGEFFVDGGICYGGEFFTKHSGLGSVATDI